MSRSEVVINVVSKSELEDQIPKLEVLVGKGRKASRS